MFNRASSSKTFYYAFMDEFSLVSRAEGSGATYPSKAVQIWMVW
jgi:hypothetical protein